MAFAVQKRHLPANRGDHAAPNRLRELTIILTRPVSISKETGLVFFINVYLSFYLQTIRVPCYGERVQLSLGCRLYARIVRALGGQPALHPAVAGAGGSRGAVNVGCIECLLRRRMDAAPKSKHLSNALAGFGAAPHSLASLASLTASHTSHSLLSRRYRNAQYLLRSFSEGRYT